MRSKTPKQFLLLAGHTVLWHALKAAFGSEIDEIVLVTPRPEKREPCASGISGVPRLSQIDRSHRGRRGAVTRSSRDSLRYVSAARSWFLSTMPRAPLWQELLTRMREAGRTLRCGRSGVAGKGHD